MISAGAVPASSRAPALPGTMAAAWRLAAIKGRRLARTV
jgi:hypothetical protein